MKKNGEIVAQTHPISFVRTECTFSNIVVHCREDGRKVWYILRVEKRRSISWEEIGDVENKTIWTLPIPKPIAYFMHWQLFPEQNLLLLRYPF